jgi:SAM-dependent methyltransferase
MNNLINIINTFKYQQSIKQHSDIDILNIVSSWSGRGIVIPAGGDRLLTNAYINIKYIREKLESNIPIEIWYLGDKEKNIYIFEELSKLKNILFINAEKVREEYPFRILNGWELKIYALIHSQFQEVLLLDSDCFLLQKPEDLFANTVYEEFRAVFSTDLGIQVEDGAKIGRKIDPETLLIPTLGQYNAETSRWDHSKPNEIWKLTSTDPDNLPEFESGFIMVDKTLHYEPLFFIRLLNEYSDIVYKYIYGDKDTFHIGWAHYKHKCNLITKGVRTPDYIQTYLDDKVLFQHRVLNAKFNPQILPQEHPNNIPIEHYDIFQKFLKEAIILVANQQLNNVYNYPRRCGKNCQPKCDICIGMHGSSIKGAFPYIEYIKSVIQLNEPNHILDIGCGNGLLLSFLNIDTDILHTTRYTGIDISKTAIEEAKNHFKESSHQIKFTQQDMLYYDIPNDIDLIIIKDFFNHLSFDENKSILYKILNSNYKYLVICNDMPDKNNIDILRGQYRPLDIVKYINNELPEMTSSFALINDFIYNTTGEDKRIITLRHIIN